MRHGTPSVLCWLLSAAAIVHLVAMPAGAAEPSSKTGAESVTPARRAELAQLVRHDCGSCHGLTLRGGLGPALTPDALANKPPAYLKAMILDGRRGTAMPGWRPLLSEAEAAWIAENLARGIPDAR
jgi:cytochrome c55X